MLSSRTPVAIKPSGPSPLRRPGVRAGWLRRLVAPDSREGSRDTPCTGPPGSARSVSVLSWARCVTTPCMKFDSPRKSATKRVAGSLYISGGVPTCSITPCRMIAIRSEIRNASPGRASHRRRSKPSCRWSCLSFPLHLFPQLLVERTQRFVHQECSRLEHQRPREGHALLLSTTKLPRQPRPQAFQSDQRKDRIYPLTDCLAVKATDPQRKCDILENGQVGEECVALEIPSPGCVAGLEPVTLGDRRCRPRPRLEARSPQWSGAAWSSRIHSALGG